jgi:hypothetical protein
VRGVLLATLDDAELPATFLASTRKKYFVPLVSPVTVAGRDAHAVVDGRPGRAVGRSLDDVVGHLPSKVGRRHQPGQLDLTRGTSSRRQTPWCRRWSSLASVRSPRRSPERRRTHRSHRAAGLRTSRRGQPPGSDRPTVAPRSGSAGTPTIAETETRDRGTATWSSSSSPPERRTY